LKQKELTPEVRHLIAQAFEGAGGMKKFLHWAKSNPMLFYTQCYVKLLPYTVTTPADTADPAADRAAKEEFDALIEKIATNKANYIIEQHAGITHTFSGGPDIYRQMREADQVERRWREEQRAIDAGATIEHEPQEIQRAVERDACVIIDEPKTNQLSADVARPPPEVLTPEQAKRRAMQPSFIAPQSQPSRPTAAPSTIPGLCAGAALDGSNDALNTTERYLLWKGHGGPP
jgi:hypothetical protein